LKPFFFGDHFAKQPPYVSHSIIGVLGRRWRRGPDPISQQIASGLLGFSARQRMTL
jgi:hypothetical protein